MFFYNIKVNKNSLYHIYIQRIINHFLIIKAARSGKSKATFIQKSFLSDRGK